MTDRNTELHRNVVIGIVRMIRDLSQVSPTRPRKLKEVYEDACTSDAEADAIIKDFALQVLWKLDAAFIKEVVDGDYESVWWLVNISMERVGHRMIEPEEISEEELGDAP